MADLTAALNTQLSNIQKKTGKSLAELQAAVAASGAVKHGEKRGWLIEHYGLGFGDANALIHTFAKPLPEMAAPATSEAGSTETGDPLALIYVGPKAALRPLHDAILRMVEDFGDFEIAPKKANVSLRRKKQFATVGPATRELIEIGLNFKGFSATPRLKILPPGGMCQASVRLGSLDEVDGELQGWLRVAFEAAG